MYHRGIPIAKMGADGLTVELIGESCCYDCHIDDLTPEEAIALGGLLMTLGKITLEKKEKFLNG